MAFWFQIQSKSQKFIRNRRKCIILFIVKSLQNKFKNLYETNSRKIYYFPPKLCLIYYTFLIYPEKGFCYKSSMKSKKTIFLCNLNPLLTFPSLVNITTCVCLGNQTRVTEAVSFFKS